MTTPVAYILIGLSICGQLCQAEIYSSVAEFRNLIASLDQVPELVGNYMRAERERLNHLQRLTHQFSKMREQNAHLFNADAMNNPTFIYVISKMLMDHWLPIEHAMRQNIAEGVLHEAKTGRRMVFPTIDDAKDLAQAMFILQTTYDLDIKDLADGKYLGNGSPVVMTAKDCFDIGRIALDTKRFHHAALWLEEALERIEREKPNHTIAEAEIFEHFSFALSEIGETHRALEVTKRIQTLTPSHPWVPRNIARFEYILSRNQTRCGLGPYPCVPENAKWRKYGFISSTHPDRLYDHYAALCRGDVQQPVSETSKLSCYYKTDKPFLKIAAIKVEMVMREPTILLFRDVISDREIELVIKLGLPKLQPSTIGAGVKMPDIRVSKNTWLHDRDHPIASVLNKRVADITTLDMLTSEPYQVGHYGIGGHYRPHFDSQLADENGERDQQRMKTLYGAAANGDRIATLMFYLSNPIAGGATVFPELNLTLCPTKNDAVFWFNYKRNGKSDLRMQHSGCPVLIGSKWILNKWIHEIGQEFKRPCSVHKEEE